MKANITDLAEAACASERPTFILALIAAAHAVKSDKRRMVKARVIEAFALLSDSAIVTGSVSLALATALEEEIEGDLNLSSEQVATIAADAKLLLEKLEAAETDSQKRLEIKAVLHIIAGAKASVST